MKSRLGFAFAILPFLIGPNLAVAQTDTGGSAETETTEEENPDLDKLSEAFDPLFANDNPTFSMLGVAQSDIQTPETPATLAAAILNGLDQNGNLQQGLAFEFVPAQLFAGRTLTVEDYRKKYGWLERSLVRMQFGIGAAKGSDEADPSLKVAAGFVWQPVNGLDPLKNGPRYVCTDEARIAHRIQSGRPENIPNSPGRAKIDKELAEAIGGCRKKILLPQTTLSIFNFPQLF